jgi:hypothetical protein
MLKSRRFMTVGFLPCAGQLHAIHCRIEDEDSPGKPESKPTMTMPVRSTIKDGG